MTMSFFLNAGLGDLDGSDLADVTADNGRSSYSRRKDEVPLLKEKLSVPSIDGMLPRPRLLDLLERSTIQFGGTLVSGRAGTGKSALAAQFSHGRSNVSWYSIDPADGDWSVFSQYFYAATTGTPTKASPFQAVDPETGETDQPAMAEFLVECFSSGKTNDDPQLIVLDNVHHLFDSNWFCDFFSLMLFSMTSGSHVLMLCRSRPPAPLWRLRSKQVLNVIDEKLLAFTPAESEAFCKARGVSRSRARRAHSESFGRVSKLMQAIRSSDQGPSRVSR
jgi:ATP/maltotriose-dependent transcriptional regulator MalT